MTIGKRITLGFSVLLALITLLALSTWYQTGKVTKGVDSLTHDSLPGLKLASSVLEQTLTYRIISMKHLLSDQADEMAALDRKADEQAQAILASLAAYDKTISTAEDRKNFAKVEPLLNAYRSMAKQIRKFSTEKKEHRGHRAAQR